MTDKEVRVRFAPSPTGPLHIGGVRTALFNYLFARGRGGTFILRIEDTDQARYVPGAEEYIIESLRWCGIQIDEGVTAGGPHAPYRQSERRDIYRDHAQLLVDSGHAYEAFDTPEELEQLRKQSESTGRTFTYDAKVRGQLKNSLVLSEEEVSELRKRGVPSVIRFRMPENEEVIFADIIRGEVRVESSTLDDKVLMKADGMPTYHLANVVDDHLMRISHVIRGEEWLPSTPLHVLLYRAFGWEDRRPGFAHMPLTLKPDGKGKLSKRDGDRLGFPVFPLEWTNPETGERSAGYRESGYLPEAFVNILAMLGWNPGTGRELFTMDELIEAFTLDRIIKSGSRFDPEKAKWFNHQYLVNKDSKELAMVLKSKLKDKGLEFGLDYITPVIELVKERAFLLDDLWRESKFFFEPPSEYDPKVANKVWKEGTSAVITSIRDQLKQSGDLNRDQAEHLVKEYAARAETGLGKILNPLRLLLVGTNAGPGIFDMIAVMGTTEVVRRIERGLQEFS